MVSPARFEHLALIYFCGLSGSFLYTGGRLKYIGFGDLVILIMFGPISVLFSFMAQTARFDPVTMLYALPLALNTEAILHSNNTRDIETDRKAGAVTLASVIGPTLSHILFALFLFVPYIFFMVATFHCSFFFSLPLITIPKAFELERQFRSGQLRHIPKRMANLNFYFGVFYLLACCLVDPKNFPGLVVVR